MDVLDLRMIVRSGNFEGTSLSMRYDSTCTLDVLYTFLQQKFPRKLVRLHVSDDMPLSFCPHSLFSIQNNLITDVFPSPRLIALAVLDHGPLINVRVKGIGSEKLFCLHTTDTVGLLKTIALQDEGLNINEENIKVALEGHWANIDKDMTLAEARIKDMSCIHIDVILAETCQNENSEVNVSFVDQIKRKTSRVKIRDFSHLRNGLSVEGICQNKQCMNHKKTVICYHGLGLFLFHNLRSQCLACRFDVNIKNFIFVNCFYRIQGQIRKGKRVSQIVQWKKLRDTWRIWDPKKSAVNQWAVMEFSTRPLNLAMNVDGNDTVSEAPIGHTCALCMDKMGMEEAIHMLPCCHSFHSLCFSNWSMAERDKKTGRTCPICIELK